MTHDPTSAPQPPGAYDDAVRALFARRPEFIVPGLERIRALCARLGHPERGAPTIHITGTNGKTSIARMASSLLTACGRRAGTYTSPHLQDVRERIRIAGEPIAREDVVSALERLGPHVAGVETERGEMVSFFEVLTAVALDHFARAGADTRVLEVGMGGRWDATNVVDAEVAVVGRIGLDHAELGSTLDEVAAEKAGIIKDGATVVSAAQEPGPAAVIAAAVRARGARLIRAGRDVGVMARRPHAGGQELTLAGIGGTLEAVHLPVHGEHQADNAVVALAAVELLALPLSPEAVREGFAAVRSPGRLEVVDRPGQAPVVLDGAHNPLGARALAASLRLELPFRRRVVVLGVMGDKDLDGILNALREVCDHVVATEAPISRAASADRIAKLARIAGVPVSVTRDVPAALAAASALAASGDAVVVTGSLYTVGAARDALGLGIS